MRKPVPVTESDLTAAVSGAVAALGEGVDRDWSVRAGTLTWSCSKTAGHVADDLVAYAGQLASCAQEGYLPFRSRPVRGTPSEGLLELIEGMGALLATVVRAAAPEARGWHPYGMADAEGFAAVGVAEVLLHTHDIATGLGIAYQPDADRCARVVARLHRDLEPHDDPWTLLLWATGRADIPGRDHVRRWRWWPGVDR